MNILIGTIVLAALACWVWRKLETEPNRVAALSNVRRMLINNTPRVVVALISAGLFAELLPQEIVRAYLGDTSDFGGVLLGAALGVLTPGGAFVSFALAAGAAQAGATMPAMIAYLTAWSLFGLTRIVTEELAFMGPAFLMRRIVVTLPVPLVAGGIALWAV